MMHLKAEPGEPFALRPVSRVTHEVCQRGVAVGTALEAWGDHPASCLVLFADKTTAYGYGRPGESMRDLAERLLNGDDRGRVEP